MFYLVRTFIDKCPSIRPLMQSKEYPTEAFIKFLATYGPGGESNESLFDESVIRTSKKAGVKPFNLESADLKTFIEYVKGCAPCNILITGVAGDGKTYLCRRAWRELGGDEDSWDQSNDVTLTIQTDSGHTRKVRFVKDLTDGVADGDLEDKSHILNLLIDTKDDPSFTLVIACNHGQILKKLQASSREELHKFEKQLNHRFFDLGAELPEQIKLIDLKRNRQDDMFKKIVKLICTHEKWADCEHCSKKLECPIRRNCQMLYADGDFTELTNRMAMLFRLLELEGSHFPIREQLLFVVNGILGKSPCKGKSSSISVKCREIFANPGEINKRVNLFDNLMGWNLSKKKQEFEIYKQINRFEIGKTSKRDLDALLMDEDPSSSIEVKENPHIFSEEFLVARKKYLCEQRIDSEDIIQFQHELKRARCRLFFTLNQKDDVNAYWSLTALPNIHKYFSSVVNELEKSNCASSNFRGLSLDATIFGGLCRVMTGQKAESHQTLAVTTRGTEVSAKSGIFEVASFLKKKEICIQKEAAASSLPVIVVRTQNANDQPYPVTLKLTPWIYEALAQFHEGYTASSFSSQLLSELMGFKAKLIWLYQECNREYVSDSETEIKLYDSAPIVIRRDDENG